MIYTENDLWDFVYRADTWEKISLAENWLKAHVKNIDLFNDLMVALSIQSRNLNRSETGRDFI